MKSPEYVAFRGVLGSSQIKDSGCRFQNRSASFYYKIIVLTLDIYRCYWNENQFCSGDDSVVIAKNREQGDLATSHLNAIYVHLITKTAFFCLKHIPHLHLSVSYSSAESLIHAFIKSRLDYCNNILGCIIREPTGFLFHNRFISNSFSSLTKCSTTKPTLLPHLLSDSPSLFTPAVHPIHLWVTQLMTVNKCSISLIPKIRSGLLDSHANFWHSRQHWKSTQWHQRVPDQMSARDDLGCHRFPKWPTWVFPDLVFKANLRRLKQQFLAEVMVIIKINQRWGLRSTVSLVKARHYDAVTMSRYMLAPDILVPKMGSCQVNAHIF